MHRYTTSLVVMMIVLGCPGCRKSKSAYSEWNTSGKGDIALPKAKTNDGLPLNKVLASRRSVRDYESTSLTPEELSQLCWASQGITEESGKRTAPSAGALYPIQVFVVTSTGMYQYDPKLHLLRNRLESDLRIPLRKAALDQSAISRAPASFVITMDVAVTANKYGKDAQRYCLIEAGHVAQNLLLEATSLGLGAVPIGAVIEKKVAKVLGLPKNLRSIYVIPIGHPKK
jgi:SagB-type dehydrogenase family enzyme